VLLGKEVTKCSHVTITSDFLELLIEKQLSDAKIQKIVKLLGYEKAKDFVMGMNRVLRFKDRVCIPKDLELKRVILEEGHKSRLSMHPIMTKMYHDLKESFWWSRMKHDVAQFISSCLTCQKAKVEHQKTRRNVVTVRDISFEMG